MRSIFTMCCGASNGDGDGDGNDVLDRLSFYGSQLGQDFVDGSHRPLVRAVPPTVEHQPVHSKPYVPRMFKGTVSSGGGSAPRVLVKGDGSGGVETRSHSSFGGDCDLGHCTYVNLDSNGKPIPPHEYSVFV